MTVYNIPTCEWVMVKGDLIVCGFAASEKEIQIAHIDENDINFDCSQCPRYSQRFHNYSLEELIEEGGHLVSPRDYVEITKETREDGSIARVSRLDRWEYTSALVNALKIENEAFCSGGIDVLKEDECTEGYDLSDFKYYDNLNLKMPKYLFILDKREKDYYIFLDLEDCLKEEDKEDHQYYLGLFQLGNVHQDGEICFGDYEYSLNNIREVHNMFWESDFNSDLNDLSGHSSSYIREYFVDRSIKSMNRSYYGVRVLRKLFDGKTESKFYEGGCKTIEIED